MAVSPLGLPVCIAGRTAFFDGRWNDIPPCPTPAQHHLFTTVPGIELTFCAEHIQQLIAAGLISHPYVDADQLAQLQSGAR